MAIYLRIGPTTDLYDLTDESTDGHIYVVLGGIRTAQKKDDYWIETYECMATGTHTSIVNFEEDIVDHLENGRKYVEDIHEGTPIWLYEYADGESAKRALVRGGTLTPYSKGGASRLLDLADRGDYILTVKRGPWEDTTERTEVSAVTFDGTVTANSTEACETILGDKVGRISQFLVRGTSTNTEAAPLTKVWAGIRPKYEAQSSFDPVWDLENSSTLENDTAVANAADNAYPNGSSTSNILETTFATQEGWKRRAQIKLEDGLGVTDLMVNGGAEDGDLTGWSDESAGWSADGSHKNSGSYGFYADESNSNAEIISTSSMTVAAGDLINVSFYYQIYAVSGGFFEISINFYDGASLDSTNKYVYSSVNGGFDKITRVLEVPTDVDGVKIKLLAVAIDGNSIEVAVDDIELYRIAATHFIGEYQVLARAKVASGSGDIDIGAYFGYTGSAQMTPLGPPQSVTGTDWKLIPLGVASFPPHRYLADVDTAWWMNNLGFDIYAELITGTASTHNLHLDALILIPYKHNIFIEDCSVCRSSYTIDDAETEYRYADLDIRISEAGEIVVFAESESFTGVDTGITESITNWVIPNEDCLLVCFAERDASHELADDFVVTLKYYPRYDTRNTD